MEFSHPAATLTPSDSSIDIIHDRFTSLSLGRSTLPLSANISDIPSHAYLNVGGTNGQVEVPHLTGKAARRWMKQRLRLAERLGPVRLAARDRRKTRSKELKEDTARLFKDAGMKGELKRAMKTKISPQLFQVLDVGSWFDTHNESQYAQLNSTLGVERSVGSDGFPGQITVQDHLEAMKQAFSDGVKQKVAGRHAFYVDAALSCKHDLTGIGVVFETHPRNGASQWTVKGYQVCERLSKTDAETLAIWRAMEIILERTHCDRVYKGHRNFVLLQLYSPVVKRRYGE
ncbi:MAG: hypothetical protein Q9209_005592 [Squamulea sp. 1 TL-2023]